MPNILRLETAGLLPLQILHHLAGDVRLIFDWLRIIRVLGQIIKNSANTLGGEEKRELVESIFNGAARIVSLQGRALREGREEVLLQVFKHVRNARPMKSETENKMEAVRRVGFLLAGSAIGLVDVVSRAVGEEVLAPTFH